MNLELTYTGSLNNVTLHLPISKSECNRLLIANYLSGNTLDIAELSEADDTQTLKKCLDKIDTETTFDVSHAGTAFRFLTALYIASATSSAVIMDDSLRGDSPCEVPSPARAVSLIPVAVNPGHALRT